MHTLMNKGNHRGGWLLVNLGEDGRGFQEGRGRRHTRASKVSLKWKEKVIVSKSNLLSWQLTLLSYKIREDEG